MFSTLPAVFHITNKPTYTSGLLLGFLNNCLVTDSKFEYAETILQSKYYMCLKWDPLKTKAEVRYIQM